MIEPTTQRYFTVSPVAIQVGDGRMPVRPDGYIGTISHGDRLCDTLCLSAKVAADRALTPLTRKALDFTDIELAIDEKHGAVIASLVFRHSPWIESRQCVEGRLARVDRRVATTAWLAP